MPREGVQTPAKVYETLRPLMKRCGATCSPEELYWAVNKAYHAAESKRYDAIHSDMYEEEEKVWKELLEMLPTVPETLMFLDIGCGTGLVGHFVSTICPHRVGAMHLLDPSREMLDVVREKAQGWPFETVLHRGDILSLPKDLLFNVVTINSVLHHVVDLAPFLARVESLLQPGGLLLTAQDPRQGAENDSICRQHKATVNERREQRLSLLRKLRRLIAPPIKKMLKIERHDALTQETNWPLLEAGIITKGMDNKSIWAITDFHVPNQPGNLGQGLDAEKMVSLMPSMKFLETLTYHYHDVSWSSLTEEEQQQEKQWWKAGDMHGAEMALVWQKRPC